jgi:transcription-repair coupling factor (superfamily II helicase)
MAVETTLSESPRDKAANSLKRIGPGQRCAFSGLVGSSKAFLLASAFKNSPRPVLAVLPTEEEAADFNRDLAFFLGNEKTVLFPSSDSTLFGVEPASPEAVTARFETLYRLQNPAPAITVVSARTLLERLMPRDVFSSSAFTLKRGEERPRDALVLKLLDAGYETRSMVEEKGEMSVRGGVMDIFPPLLESPVRVEFFSDEIESMRLFDISTQRSIKEIDEALILPAHELIATQEGRILARAGLIERAAEIDALRKEWEPINEELRDGKIGARSRALWPLFYEKTSTLFDYLPTDTAVALVDPRVIREEMDAFAGEIKDEEARLREGKKLFLDASGLYVDAGELDGLLGHWGVMELASIGGAAPGAVAFSTSRNLDVRQEVLLRKSDAPFRPLVEKINSWLENGQKVLVTAHNSGQAERTLELLSGYGLRPAIRTGQEALSTAGQGRAALPGFEISVGALSTGFRFEEAGLVIVSEEEIFGERLRRNPPRGRKLENFLSELRDLGVGDPVVHAEHGIAVYRGIRRMEVERMESDYLTLEYLGGDRLYVPVERMALVARYHGVEGRAFVVDRLGGSAWKRRTGKARRAVEKIAAELLKLYAERESSVGFAFSKPDHLYEEFEESFEYVETPDQAEAISDVLKDMERERPMDRLVCGDVGYGKTEVAMRAAFKAVLDNKQVAVLVPTTVLAQQHGVTFNERFAAYPARIEVLSRFKSAGEQKEIIARAGSGEIDVLIGTHRLLARDVKFKDLGLVVVDEEHRFGVKHKERLKELKREVDVLTLTATPIPRTLQMSVGGLRDLSVISTPPEDRHAIKTAVVPFDDDLIKDAIERELKRGGQVFFVHNRIGSMGAMAEYLAGLVPTARIAAIHGRMNEREMEKKMLAFVNGEADVLLSTAIIESGLDIPRANTIIINRADRFGLADLYQLRGRVGRGSVRAHAYLICPVGAMTPEAEERLDVVSALTDPGSGFRIASRDLEIRGSGELLGSAQSGRIADVGFDMYMQLLEEAVAEIKGEKARHEPPPEINLRVSRYIPDDYMPDARERLGVYKRLSAAHDESEIDALADEMVDRYGEMPGLVKNLVAAAEIGVLVGRASADELVQRGARLYLRFRAPVAGSAPHDGEQALNRALDLVKKNPARFKATPDSRLVFLMSNPDDPLGEARYLLKEILA